MIAFKPPCHAANESESGRSLASGRQVSQSVASLRDVDKSVARTAVFGECGYDHSDIRGDGDSWGSSQATAPSAFDCDQKYE